MKRQSSMSMLLKKPSHSLSVQKPQTFSATKTRFLPRHAVVASRSLLHRRCRRKLTLSLSRSLGQTRIIAVSSSSYSSCISSPEEALEGGFEDFKDLDEYRKDVPPKGSGPQLNSSQELMILIVPIKQPTRLKL